MNSHALRHQNLNLACLPISPYPRSDDRTAQSHSSQDFISGMPRIFLGHAKVQGSRARRLYNTRFQRIKGKMLAPIARSQPALRTASLRLLSRGCRQKRDAASRRVTATGSAPSIVGTADGHPRCAIRISSMWTLHCTNRFEATIFQSSRRRGDSRPGAGGNDRPQREVPQRSGLKLDRIRSSALLLPSPLRWIGNTPPPGCQSPL